MAAGPKEKFDLGGMDPKEAAQMMAFFRSLESALERLRKTTGSFSSETDKSAKSLGYFNKRLKDGVNEADNFAEGLGKSSTGMIAAGLATTYLLAKFKSLFDNVKSGLRDLKRYRIEVATLAKTSLVAPGGVRQLEGVRAELNMTRQEFAGFAKELRRGVMEGVASTEQLVRAGKQLRDTFSGDQTENLREFVNLLKAIPTVDTDLNFTATMDDRAAAIFALAEEGKIESVIKMQSAGLLGAGILGPQPIGGAKEDVDMLNSMERVESTQQRIEDVLLGTLPSWSPQIAVVSTGVAAMGVGVTTLVKGGAAFLTLAARGFAVNTAAVRGVERAVYSTRGKAAAASGISKRSMFDIKAVLTKALGRGNLLRGARAARAVKGAASVAGPAVAIAAVAVGAQIFGSKLSKLGKTLEGENKRAKAGLSQLAAAILKNTSVIGIFTGGITDAGRGFENLGGSMSDWSESVVSATINGVQKYSWGARQFAKIIGSLGSVVGGAGKAISYLWGGVTGAADVTGEFISNVWSSSKIASEAAEEVKKESIRRIAHVRALERTNKTLFRTNQALQERALMQQRSALSLQRAFKGIDNAAKTLATRLADFQGEIAGLKIEKFATIGGTVGEFNAALADATSAATDRFGIMMKAMDKWREEIITDATLTVKDRQHALAKVNKVELEATHKYARSVGDLIGKFDRIPEVVLAGLENKIRRTEFEVKIEAGAMGREEMFGNLRQQLSTSFDSLVHVVGQAAEDYARAEQSALRLRQQNESLAKTVNDVISKMPKDVAGDIRKQLRTSVTFQGGKVEIFDPKQLAEVKIEADKRLVEFNDKIKAIGKPLELEGDIAKIIRNIDASNKELDSLKSNLQLTKAKQGSVTQTLADSKKDFDKRTKQLESNKENAAKQRRFNEAYVAYSEANVESQKLVLKMDEEKLAIQRKESEVTSFRQKQAELLGQAWSQLQKEGKNLTGEAKQYYNELKPLIKTSGDIAGLSKDNRSKLIAALSAANNDSKTAKIELEKEANEVGKKLVVYERLLKIQQTNVFLAQQSAKITQGLFENIQDFDRTLGQVVSAIGRSAQSQQIQRTVDTLEAQRDTFILFGRVEEQINSEVAGYTNLLQEGLKDATVAQAVLKEVNKRLQDSSEMFKSASVGVGKSVDAFSKAMDLNFKKLNDVVGAGQAKAFSDQIDQLKKAASEISRIRALGPNISKTDQSALTKAQGAFDSAFKTISADVDFLADDSLKKQMGQSLQNFKRAVTLAEEPVKNLEAAVRKASDESKKRAAEITTNVQRSLDAMVRASENIRKTFNFRQFFDVVELQNALTDVAGETLNFAKAGETTTESIKEASAAYDILIAGLNKRLENIPEQIEKEAAVLEAAGKTAEATELRTAGKRAQMAKVQTDRAKAELEWKERVVGAAEREFSIRNEMISAEQDTLSTVADFIAEIGGNFDTVLQLQEKAASLEIDRLNATKDTMDRLQTALESTTDLKLRENLTKSIRLQEFKIVKQQIEVQRKFLGVQRSMFDRLAGMAFGQLRTESGGRRRRGRVSRVFGQGFIYDRNGKPIGGTAGSSKTLDERSSGRRVKGGLSATPFLRGAGLGAGVNRNPIEKLDATAGKQVTAVLDNTSATVDLTSVLKGTNVGLRDIAPVAGGGGGAVAGSTEMQKVMSEVAKSVKETSDSTIRVQNFSKEVVSFVKSFGGVAKGALTGPERVAPREKSDYGDFNSLVEDFAKKIVKTLTPPRLMEIPDSIDKATRSVFGFIDSLEYKDIFGTQSGAQIDSTNKNNFGWGKDEADRFAKQQEEYFREQAAEKRTERVGSEVLPMGTQAAPYRMSDVEDVLEKVSSGFGAVSDKYSKKTSDIFGKISNSAKTSFSEMKSDAKDYFSGAKESTKKTVSVAKTSAKEQDTLAKSFVKDPTTGRKVTLGDIRGKQGGGPRELINGQEFAVGGKKTPRAVIDGQEFVVGGKKTPGAVALTTKTTGQKAIEGLTKVEEAARRQQSIRTATGTMTSPIQTAAGAPGAGGKGAGAPPARSLGTVELMNNINVSLALDAGKLSGILKVATADAISNDASVQSALVGFLVKNNVLTNPDKNTTVGGGSR